MPWKGSCTQST